MKAKAMKAHALLALLMACLVTCTFGVSLQAAGEGDGDGEITLPVVYDPIAALNAAAGTYGIGGEDFQAEGHGAASFAGPFSVHAQKSASDTTKVDLADAYAADTVYNNVLRFRHDEESPRAWIEIMERTKGDAATRSLWWTCGESWYYGIPMLVFTVPESGKYDIGANTAFPNVGLTPGAVRDCPETYQESEVTFEILKNGKDVLGSCTFSAKDAKDDQKVAFPAVQDVDLLAKDTIVFRARVDTAFLDACWYGATFEAVPVITLKELNEENAPPALAADKTAMATTIGKAVSLPLSAVDADDDPLTFAQTVEAQHGTVAVDADEGTVTYTPAAGFYGEDTFTLKANDGEADSNELRFTVSVYRSISAAVAAIKANMAYFYEGPQGTDYLDIDQSLCDWQWQVAYDGLLGLNEEGWRSAEMAKWSQWGIELVHVQAPQMNITETDQLLLNSDKPLDAHAKGGLTYVAPEDGLYRLTHTDVLATIGLDEWRVKNADQVAQSDRYTTPVYVSITKDNRVVWPANGEPLKLDPADLDHLSVDFPTIETAMKKGDQLRIVVQMDDACTGWMNRVVCDPVVYGIGDYDESKDLHVSGQDESKDPDDTGTTTATQKPAPTEGTGTTSPISPTGTKAPDQNGSDGDPSPDTGYAFPSALAILGVAALAAGMTRKKK